MDTNTYIAIYRNCPLEIQRIIDKFVTQMQRQAHATLMTPIYQEMTSGHNLKSRDEYLLEVFECFGRGSLDLDLYNSIERADKWLTRQQFRHFVQSGGCELIQELRFEQHGWCNCPGDDYWKRGQTLESPNELGQTSWD
jgi:hypothetical protein